MSVNLNVRSVMSCRLAYMHLLPGTKKVVCFEWGFDAPHIGGAMAYSAFPVLRDAPVGSDVLYRMAVVVSKLLLSKHIGHVARRTHQTAIWRY